MPISIEDLQKAQRPLRERVLEFLGKTPQQAFTLLEVFTGVEGYDRTTAAVLLLTTSVEQRAELLRPVETELIALQKEGSVKSAPYQGQIYYAMGR